MSGKHPIYSLRNTAILVTSYIIRKALQSENWRLSGGNHHCFKRSTGKKGPVTRDNNNIIIIIIIIIIILVITFMQDIYNLLTYSMKQSPS